MAVATLGKDSSWLIDGILIDFQYYMGLDYMLEWTVFFIKSSLIGNG